MEGKCPNRLGAYLPFPEMTSAISKKIPGELFNRWSMKAGRYRNILAHHHCSPMNREQQCSPPQNSTGWCSSSSDPLQQWANGAQTDLPREQCLPRLFCSLSGKQAQLAFLLIRSIFVHSKIKESFKVSPSNCSWCMQHNRKAGRLSTAQLFT